MVDVGGHWLKEYPHSEDISHRTDFLYCVDAIAGKLDTF